LPYLPTKVRGDFAESFEGGIDIFDDFLHEHVELGKLVGLFETLIAGRSIGSRLRAGEIRIMSPGITPGIFVMNNILQ